MTQVAGMLLCLAGCSKSPAPSTGDPLAARIQSRIDLLIPHVEAVTGRSLEHVKAVVVTPNQAVKAGLKEARLLYGHPGAERWQRDLFSHEFQRGAVAMLIMKLEISDDSPSPRVLVLDAGPEDKTLVSAMRARNLMLHDPEQLDILIIHELAHAFQLEYLGLKGFLGRSRSPTDRLARETVVEGHAEYVTRQVSRATNLASSWRRHRQGRKPTPLATKDPAARIRLAAERSLLDYQYTAGLRFVEQVAERLGEVEAVKRLFSEPAPSLAAISDPEAYVTGQMADENADRLGETVAGWLAFECGLARAHPEPTTYYELAADTDRRAGDSLRYVGAQRISGYGKASLLGTVEISLLACRNRRSADDAYQGVERYRSSTMNRVGVSRRRLKTRATLFQRRPSGGPSEVVLLTAWGTFVAEIRVSDPVSDEWVLGLGRRLVILLGEGGSAPALSKRLKRLCVTERADEILAARKDKNPDVRVLAVHRLAVAKGKYRRELEQALIDPDPGVRSSALLALLDEPGGDRAAKRTLLALGFGDRGGSVVAATCRWVKSNSTESRLNSKDSAHRIVPWKDLRVALNHSDDAARRASFSILGWDHVVAGRSRGPESHRVSQPELLAVLKVKLRDTVTEIRAHAAWLLSFLVDPALDVAPAYETALSDSSPEVRRNALESMFTASWAPSRVLRSVMNSLADDDPMVRFAAVYAVALYGRNGRPALPILRRLLRDADPILRGVIEQAIHQIEDADGD